MFKIIKENKIIGISEEYPVLLDEYEVVEDTGHQVTDYKHYDGEFTLRDIEKDNEEMKQARANAYQAEVDPITAHIQRLRDTNPMTEEVEQEIAELIDERDDKVQEIKERFPYQGRDDNSSPKGRI